MSELFTTLIPMEADPEDEPQRSYIGSRRWYDGSELCIWLVFGEDMEVGVPHLTYVADDDGPNPPWLDWEIDGLGNLHEVVLRNDDALAFMLEYGIAPGQPFFVRLSYSFTPGDGWETDADSDVDVEVLDVTPWPESRVVDAWEALLFRRHCSWPVMALIKIEPDPEVK